MKTNRLTLTEFGTSTVMELSAPDDKGRRRFTMIAYTGDPVAWDGKQFVIELEGIDASGKRKPILREHDRKQIAGYADEIVVDERGILMNGYLSKSTTAGKEIADLADEGFPWQASIGIDIHEVEKLDRGETRLVNGREMTGPAYVAIKSTLRESSFVPLGADSNTSAVVFTDGGDFSSLIQEKLNMADNAKPTPADDNALADAENTGFKRGYDQAKAELASMLQAFPDRIDFALKQFSSGASVKDAKAELSDILLAELAAEKELSAKAIAEAKAAADTASPAPLQLAAATEPTGKPDANDHKAVAAWEWDTQKPAGFSSKENYIAFRSAELSGRIRVMQATRPA